MIFKKNSFIQLACFLLVTNIVTSLATNEMNTEQGTVLIQTVDKEIKATIRNIIDESITVCTKNSLMVYQKDKKSTTHIHEQHPYYPLATQIHTYLNNLKEAYPAVLLVFINHEHGSIKNGLVPEINPSDLHVVESSFKENAYSWLAAFNKKTCNE